MNSVLPFLPSNIYPNSDFALLYTWWSLFLFAFIRFVSPEKTWFHPDRSNLPSPSSFPLDSPWLLSLKYPLTAAFSLMFQFAGDDFYDSGNGRPRRWSQPNYPQSPISSD